ncbi:MAG TPA: SH3 domain-containing protein, partial [Longimicrobium sp.]|nr:SH3 domain-containing protein [Longimicrobium sp.]
MSEIGTTTGSVNLRAGPGTSNAIKETLKPGTELTILGHEGEWFKVRVGATGREGFVHDDFVRLPSRTIISGFLRSMPELQAAPLAPARQKQPPAGSGPAAKTAARIWNQYGGLLTTLSERLGFEPEVGVAVMTVESGGIAFKDGRMVIRFENHVFFKHWGVDNPAKFNQHFRFNQSEKWKGHEFRPSAAAAFKPFHGTGQANEWTVFEFA